MTMARTCKSLGVLAALLLVAATLALGASQTIMLIKVEGAINPVAAEYIGASIREAETETVQCLIIQLDTPGGLDTSMREIVKAMLNAQVPVVVYVAPAGARAASAGVMITMAAHIAAMAPGTNIGAAHPVAGGGGKLDRVMSEKVENDAAAYIQSIASKRGRNAEWGEKAVRESVSIKAKEALDLKVIDLVCADLDELIQKIDGREVEVAGKKVIVATKDAVVTEKEMGLRDKILATLSDPNVAYILMMLGLAGLYFELAHPGAIFPGVIGAISLILAFYSFQTLSVDYAGFLLIFLGVVLFIMEIKVASYGLLSVGGAVCLFLGSLMLFKSSAPYLRPSMETLIAGVGITAGFFLTVASLAFRAYVRRPVSGSEGLVGREGSALSRLAPSGRVFVHGESWEAYSEEVIETGEDVEVVEVKGLKVKVRKKTTIEEEV